MFYVEGKDVNTTKHGDIIAKLSGTVRAVYPPFILPPRHTNARPTVLPPDTPMLEALFSLPTRPRFRSLQLCHPLAVSSILSLLLALPVLQHCTTDFDLLLPVATKRSFDGGAIGEGKHPLKVGREGGREAGREGERGGGGGGGGKDSS